MKNKLNISTVTPVYNGSEYIPDLVKELHVLREYLSNNSEGIRLLESIFVIDDCIDNSLEVLEEIKVNHSWIKVIVLSKNFGQHPATVAGFLFSSGDWVISLDEDLQHHPKYILDLLYTCVSGSNDICYASSINPIHDSFIRDKVSILFKKIVGKIASNKNVKHFNSYRVIRGSIARAAAAICRHDTYLDVALSWFTKRICTEAISLTDLRFQEVNKSGYSIMSLLRHAKRMIMSSKFKFLRSGMLIGIFAFLLSVLVGSYSLVARIFDFNLIGIKGWSSIMISIFFFGGLLSLMVGFMLESVSDILININGKPTFYVVDRSHDENLANELEILKKNEDIPYPKSQ